MSLAMTMRHAHLSPDHLVEARTLNPLSRWKKLDKNWTEDTEPETTKGWHEANPLNLLLNLVGLP